LLAAQDYAVCIGNSAFALDEFFAGYLPELRSPGTAVPGLSLSIKQQRPEVAIVVEAVADAAPVPAGGLAVVVVDAVEVGAPARARLWDGVGERLQHVVRDEHLRRPAADR